MKKNILASTFMLAILIGSALPLRAEGKKDGQTDIDSQPTITTNGTVVFPVLYGKNHKILGRNLEYSAAYGRRIVFKDAASEQRFPFDVDELDPVVLGTLEIDPAAQKEAQARQDLAWKQAEAACRAAAAERKREERLRELFHRPILIIRYNRY